MKKHDYLYDLSYLFLFLTVFTLFHQGFILKQPFLLKQIIDGFKIHHETLIIGGLIISIFFYVLGHKELKKCLINEVKV